MSLSAAIPTVSIAPGLFEELLTNEVHELLLALGNDQRYSLGDVDPEDSHFSLSQYCQRAIACVLVAMRGETSTERQRQLANELLKLLASADNSSLPPLALAYPLRRLLAISDSSKSAALSRPDTPLAQSALLTGTRLDPCLGSQLRKEIASADQVDILCSFIRWSGLRLLLAELQNFCASSPAGDTRLRVITTSYMGATDPKAVEAIAALPNTQVMVSYDTERTRLHAKAYIIHRKTGFGSAYIGSANISKAALSEGLEWTSKISQYELPHLWAKVVATFDTYWHDDEFEPFVGEAQPKLRAAIQRERGEGLSAESACVTFDLRPYPFQEEILEVLAAEREIQLKRRQLIIAATGTGKTMIAAFDYRNVCRQAAERPRVLYVAHREEILRQALGTFRAVLRDQNFGDLLVGGAEANLCHHLFCSIQSYNSRELWRLAVDHFDYIVVDEFHHAAAPSYQRLLDHVRPKLLLGLTATPERGDSLDVFHWFGGEASAEIRLPDAINRRLLCPFQYFGISDCVDLAGLRWQRGGYRIDDLDRVYTGNDSRAGLVVEKLSEIVLDLKRMRGLGFCVSIAHAEFMARYFSDHGISALALSANSDDEHRRSAQEKLHAREVNIIFVVDLYNEGVDIPEIDTVLFLRPTESLTVFLQQLGRGLRLDDDKECLTVLDFIGAQHHEFRFASRFRALSSDPTHRLEDEVEQEFPHLPPGCFIRLERVAQQHVLQNIRASLQLRRPRLISQLRELGMHLSRVPALSEAMSYLNASLDDLLSRGLWSRLLADAGLLNTFEDPDEEQLAKGLRRLSHIDDPAQIQFLLTHLRGSGLPEAPEVVDQRRCHMFYVTVWGTLGDGWSLAEAEKRLRNNPTAIADLRAILEYNIAHTRTVTPGHVSSVGGPLAIHAQYTRDEILAGLGHWTTAERPEFREGVRHLPSLKTDAFFVTLQKTEKLYSPSTMYEDYVISHDLFHWQSQSTTSAESTTGQRYIRHREQGYTPLLFVREHKRLESGLAAPYAFLGPAEYVSHEGSRPISIVWRLIHPIPARLFRPIGRQVAG